MTVDPNIQKKANDIRTKTYGKEVRESLASGLEEMSKDVEETKDRQTNVEQQFQAVIDETTGKDVISAPEIIAARVSATGEQNSNLKERLDKEYNKVTSQLAQTDLLRNNFLRYGKIKLPAEIPVLPFDLYRDSDGVIKHTFRFEKLLVGSHIYIDWLAGSDDNDGLTKENPVRTFQKAIELANGASGSRVIIHFLTPTFPQNYIYPGGSNYTFTLTKNITLTSDHENGTTITSGRYISKSLWTEDGSTYKASATNVHEVIDTNIKNFKGLPIEYRKVDDLVTCKNLEGSWYTDGSTIWVHRVGGIQPDGSMIVLNSHGWGIKFEIEDNALFIDGVNFFWKGTATSSLSVNGEQSSEFYHRNSSFSYSQSRHGLETTNIGKIYGFNSSAYDTGLDGFNYHGTGNEFVFEYQCTAFKNGVEGAENANATSAHNGMTVLRVGSLGYETYGPVLADVGGCFSYNIDCIMYDSLKSKSITKSAFYASGNGGKLYLINCQGGGVDTYGVNGGGGIEFYLNNFKGNVPESLNYSIVD